MRRNSRASADANARAVDLELKAARTRAAAWRLWPSATPSEPVRARSGPWPPLLGPRITAWIRTVTGIPAARCLLEPVRARPKFIETQLAVASPTSARSEVMSNSDPPKHRPARIGAETPACQLLRSSRWPPCRLAQPHATSSSTFTEVGLCGLGRLAKSRR